MTTEWQNMAQILWFLVESRPNTTTEFHPALARIPRGTRPTATFLGNCAKFLVPMAYERREASGNAEAAELAEARNQ